VAAGRIVAGPHVRDACARHLKDLKEGPKRGLVWEAESAKRFADFCRVVCCVQVGPDWVPFILHPSQWFIAGSIFGWKRKATGKRRFRTAYVEQGKGNGKSPLAAAIGHYLLVADGELSAEVYAAASKKDQAMILFRDAVTMWQNSPTLTKRLTPSGSNPVWNLAHLDTGSFFRPISAESGQSGPRPHGALIDELHEHRDGEVLRMLKAGQKARQQPLTFIITNSGADRRSVCFDEHTYAVEVAAGTKEDDEYFGYVCGLDSARTVAYDLDNVLRLAAETCTCGNAKITPSDLSTPRSFARLVTGIGGEPKTSRLAKGALITPTERLFLDAFATLVTRDSGSNAARSTLKSEGQYSDGGLNLLAGWPDQESGTGSTESGKKSPTQRGSRTERGLQSTGSPQSKSQKSEANRAAAAEFAEPEQAVSGWITATIRELFGDCSATNAMQESVCSEIASRIYGEHLPTCKVRQRFRLESGQIKEDLPADEPLDDPTCWIKTNPLLGVTIQTDYLEKQVREAKGIPAYANTVRRLNFCQWTDSVTAAISRHVWDACQGDVDADELTEKGYPCFGGLDLSKTGDLTALTLTWVLDGTTDRQKFASKTWFWTPASTMRDRALRDRAPYDAWSMQGFLEAVPGPRITYRWMADALAEICARYAPESIGGDPYGMTQLLEQCAEMGVSLPVQTHPQGFNRRVISKDEAGPDGANEVALWMPDSINKLEAALLEQRITIDPNPVMTMCAASVVYDQNRTGHRMFAKDKATNRIDGMVSLAMSIGVATVTSGESGGASFWETMAA